MKKIAILGYGTVGQGVHELLKERGGIELRHVLDLRDIPDVPLCKDFSVIEKDPSVDTVVETIGGARAAYDFTKRALNASKNVVTSNKELVAEHGAELLMLAREKGVSYLFEGAVGGGIPILGPMANDLSANKITEVYGILNGTTNFILSGMETEDISFEEALKQAQSLGYAEADPSADVDGEDALRKICILASLAFGKHIYPKWVKTEGIRHITSAHIKEAETKGYRIKLIGRAKLLNSGKAAVYVSPQLVSRDNPLYFVSCVFNSIVVEGDFVGQCMFYGQGAGGRATASAVCGDILRPKTNNMFWEDSHTDITEEINDCEFETFSDGTKIRVLP